MRGIADFLLSGVCHQLPTHSLAYQGQPLPLCARCMGTFVGVVLIFGVLRLMGRGRASGLPSPGLTIVLALFIVTWAVDGLNSLYESIAGNPLLYAPSNALRLATGLGVGMTWGTMLYPVYHQVMWADSSDERVLRGPRDMWPLMTTVLLTGLLAYYWDAAPYGMWAWACYLSVYLVLGTVNALLLVLILGREGAATRWLDIVPYLMGGLALALLETGSMAVLRYLVT